MAFGLPGALSQFSSSTLKNIQALDVITKSVPNPQSIVSDNVNNTVTKSVTTAPGEVFAGAPGAISGAAAGFIAGTTTPPTLSTTLQTSALDNLFGTGLTSGLSVDKFVTENVRLEDVIPAQQLFSIAKNLGAQSMYTDPLQAYAQVAQSSADMTNICATSRAIITDLLADISSFLSLQGSTDYNQIAAMNSAFFGKTGDLANVALGSLNLVNETFNVRKKFDPFQIANLCDALNALTNFAMFSNSKLLQLDLLRKKMNDALGRLTSLLKGLCANVASVSKYIPEYAATAAVGKLFQSVQQKVLKQSGIDMQRIIADIDAFTKLNADDKSKVLVTSAIGATAQVIRAYLCAIQPATQVSTGPDPVIINLKAGWDALVSLLTTSAVCQLYPTLLALVGPFIATTNASVTKSNGPQLASQTASMIASLTAISAALVFVCDGAAGFKTLFKAETSLDPSRVIGSNELMSDIGADAARNSVMQHPGEFTSFTLSDSTTPGQLAQEIQKQIATMPDGPEKDQLTLAYTDVYSRHRATLLGMDIQRREDVRIFTAPSGQDEDRKIIAKTVRTYSGFSDTELGA